MYVYVEYCEKIKFLNFTRNNLRVCRKFYVSTNNYLNKQVKNAFRNNKIL